MNTTPKSVAARFLPSLTDVAFIIPLLFQFNKRGGAPNLLSDGDTGWHLRTGEWILAHGQVPHQDMFSYTHAGQPWYAWEWLWDVCFGFLNQHFGLAAAIACSMLLICCTSAILYRLVLRKCSNPLIAIAVTVVASAAASIHWLVRPHLFTLFFTVIFLWILDETYVGALENPRGFQAKKLFWLLPALMVLWTNLHGGFVAGLILIGAYAGGGLLGAMLEPAGEARQLILTRVKPFILSGVLCTLATLVNPYFIGLHEHIVKYLLDPYIYKNIDEFLPFDFGHPATRYIEPLVLLTVAAAFWNLYRRRFEYFVLLCGWMYLAMHVRRNIPLFSMVCAPLVAEAVLSLLRDLQSAHTVEWIKSLVRRFEESAVEIAKTDRLPRFHVASAAAILGVTAILYAPQPPEAFRSSQDPKVFPVSAVNVLIRDGDEHVFTSDVWGGYLIYRLYPKANVFIDGRSDFYGSSFEFAYIGVVGVKHDWDETLDHYGVQTVLLPTQYALVGAMKGNRRWRVVYDDKIAIIFRLVNPGHPTQQVAKCPNQGVEQNCGKPATGAAFTGGSIPRESDHPRPNFVAAIGPPRLPLLNRP